MPCDDGCETERRDHVRSSSRGRTPTRGVDRNLYSYVSRGRVHRTIGADGRSSLFDLEELEALREKHRRPPPPPPTIDVRIASAVTQLDEDGLRYRDVPVDELVDQPFEQICALLWRTLPPEMEPARLPTGGSDAAEGVMGLVELVAGMQLPDEPFTAADILLGTIPVALGGSSDTSLTYAGRLAHAWVSQPTTELVRAINSTLVLLADHELATSTLAVRVAASVRSSPKAAFIAGLATVDGDLHGSASHHAHRLLLDCGRDGADRVLQRFRQERLRVPGFGHSIYRSRDPRFELLLERVQALPDPNGRLDTVADLLATSGRYVAQAPNIDLAIGALALVADLPPDCPVFAIARIAGWAAHYREELDERPLRFRGLAY